jgi:hypothetical protein
MAIYIRVGVKFLQLSAPFLAEIRKNGRTKIEAQGIGKSLLLETIHELLLMKIREKDSERSNTCANRPVYSTIFTPKDKKKPV